MKKHFFFFLFVLAFLFGTKTFAQEWEYTIPYQSLGEESTRQYCAYEMSDGRIIVSASYLFNDHTNKFYYPPHNALVALSSDGEELAKQDYFKPGYWGSSYNPYVFEDEKGYVFMLATYAPDHNPDYFNYFLNYDNPPADAILGLYKLDDQLQIVESYEYCFPVDPAQGQDSFDPCCTSGSLHLHSAILDDGCMVGAYTKNVSKDNDSIHDYDSIFFFRMNFEGELLANVGFETPYSGVPWQMAFWREQLVPTDYGYIYYSRLSHVPPTPEIVKGHQDSEESTDYVGGTVAYFDKDFNLLRTRHFFHPGNINNPFVFDDVSIMRSKHNTTYLATRSSRHYQPKHDDCYYYEYDDDISNANDRVPIIREQQRGMNDFDFVAECRAVDVANDGTVFFCYSLNVGIGFNDSWVVIETLDEELNTISEVYYGKGDDRLWHCAESITLASDGGVFMTTWMRKLDDMNQWGSTVVKFPAEAFLSIDEAHYNGLKVAVAYPNPGKDVLNIRTALQNANVEIYDLTGKLVYSQRITDNIIPITTTSWPSGTYIWKVIANGKEAESGKWIKE